MQRTTNNRNPNDMKDNPRHNQNARSASRNTMLQQRGCQPTETKHKNPLFNYPKTYAEVTKVPPTQQAEQATSTINNLNNRMQNHFLNPPFASNHVPHPMIYHQFYGLNNDQFRIPTVTNLLSNQR